MEERARRRLSRLALGRTSSHKARVPDEVIHSRQNPRVQALARLRDRAERDARGRFLVEGLRELSRALERKVAVEEIYFCPALFRAPGAVDLITRAREAGIPCCELGDSAFDKVSGREGPDGLIGVAETWDCSLARLAPGPNPLLLVVEAVEKPGNLGALLRTADSAGCDALIVCDPVTDLFNPNVIRAAQGAAFSMPVAVASSTETLAWLKERKVRVLATTPDGAQPLWDVDAKGPVAIVMGSEKDGLGATWLKGADARVFIPQAGLSDSLNVATAAAICLFEAVRQRR